VNPTVVACNYLQSPWWVLVVTMATYVGWPVYNLAVDGLRGLFGAVVSLLDHIEQRRRRREARRMNAAYDAAGAAYRIGSQPPSHRFQAGSGQLENQYQDLKSA
jgi:hypothetical protein